MADKHFIAGSRERKRRLGILALNGMEKLRAGDCPEPEELAALVDGTCDRSRREELLLHLDSCESCFQEWVELSGVLKVRQKSKSVTVSFFSRKKVLAAAGSALAVAASVVVFMSTPFYKESRPLSNQVIREQVGGSQETDSVLLETADRKDKEADSAISTAAEGEMEEQAPLPSAPLKKRAAAPAMGKSGPRHSQEKLYQLDTVEKAAEPEAKNEEMRNDGAKISGAPAEAEFSSLDEYQDFFAMVEGLCRAETVDVNREMVLKRARELLKKATMGDGRRRTVIEKMVQLLEGDIESSELCGRLESILGPDGIQENGAIENGKQHTKQE